MEDNVHAKQKFQQTLCWDCENATGGCRWSDRLRPIEGWKARKTHSNCGGDSYVIYECPEFVRDAMCFGTKRLREGDPLRKALETGSLTI